MAKDRKPILNVSVGSGTPDDVPVGNVSCPYCRHGLLDHVRVELKEDGSRWRVKECRACHGIFATP